MRGRIRGHQQGEIVAGMQAGCPAADSSRSARTLRRIRRRRSGRRSCPPGGGSHPAPRCSLPDWSRADAAACWRRRTIPPRRAPAAGMAGLSVSFVSCRKALATSRRKPSTPRSSHRSSTSSAASRAARVQPVQLGLLAQEFVVVILPPRRLIGPGRAAEHRQPVVGHRAVVLRIGPDIPVLLCRIAVAAGGEPGMFVARCGRALRPG